jgi:calcium permeable stress-gated cation channel
MFASRRMQVGFSLLYLAYRYNFLYAYGPVIDTKGAAFAKALQHLMTGLYLAKLYLIGLFSVGSARGVMAGGVLAIAVLLLVVAITYHTFLRGRLNTLITFLPRKTLVKEAFSAVLQACRTLLATNLTCDI